MELSELTAYAGEKYQMQEQHKWQDFPGFSVLCHPQTGKWVALLIRQWDTDKGVEIQHCDMKCGSETRNRFRKSYLTMPVRMRGKKWIGIAFNEWTERDVVFSMLDQAVASENPVGYTALPASEETHGYTALPASEETHGYTMVLTSGNQADTSGYRDTALPFAGSSRRQEKEKIPERLRKMKHLFEYGRDSAGSRAKNFYRQAVFMEDYEDDYPWRGGFVCYFPTYHDMTTRQLRGYFAWRTRLRRGDYQPIAASAAYLYIYELLNGVGADSPEACLQKMREFEKGYLDTEIGDARMRANLQRWMLEFAVLHELPPALVCELADPEVLRRDNALTVLQSPENCADEEIFLALCYFGGKKAEKTPVLTKEHERGVHLFAEVWRTASSCRVQGKDLFTRCFGEKLTRRWYPLSNAVYYEQNRPSDIVYELDECRRFYCRNGCWYTEGYEKLSYDRVLFQGFLRETDARLRRCLKTGRYLQEKPENGWVIPYVDAVIEADRKAALEAARPRISIDLSELEQIRRDSLATRDSLLVEEGPEVYEMPEEPVQKTPEEETIEKETAGKDAAEKEITETEPDGAPAEPLQEQILRALLEGEAVSGIIREHHLMPSIVADEINEMLFDEIGDNVLLCEKDELILVEDYTEEVAEYIGGTDNGQA